MKTTVKKFSRKSPKKALLFGLAQSLIMKERIKTTYARGKEASSLVERIITVGKGDSLSAQRLLSRNLSESIAKKVIKDLAPRYKERNGGYTRLVKLGRRSSDGAEIVFLEFVK